MNSGMRVGGIFNSAHILEGFHLKKKGVLLKQAGILENAGAEQIELTADLFDAECFPLDYLQRQIDELIPLKKRGMLFSLHAPCIAGIATASSHTLIRHASVETILESYKLVEALEPITVTIHPTILAEIDRELKPPDESARKYLVNLARDNEKQSLTKLSEKIPSEKICLENYHEGNLLDYRDLIESHRYSVCYDFPHDYVRNPGFDTCEIFLNEWKEFIRNIHLHNITSQSICYGIVKLTDHKPLSEPGLIHAETACRMFDSFGYTGPIIVEEYYNKRIADSILLIKKILEKIRNEKASL